MSDAPTPPTASPAAPRKAGALLPFVSVLCAALVGAGLGGWAVWHWQERIAAGLGIKTPAAQNAAVKAALVPPGVELAEPDESGRPVLYWYDPMKPDAHFKKPGPSPFMDMDLVPKYADEAPAAAPALPPGVELAEPDESGRPVLYWYDPMKPDAHFKKPGPSPFMDMDLVPKYADEAGALPAAATGITIDPTMVENLGVRSARAAEGRLTYEVRVPAEVVVNEHAFALVQARSAGFVEEAAPLAVGDRVKKGDLLARVVIPGWSDAQAEYLVLIESGAGKAQVEGVLRRLRLAGMPEDDVEELVRTRRVKTVFTLRAPIDGVVTDIALRSGMNVSTSQTVAQIEGLDPVWVTASVPERYAASLDGADLVLTADAYPGRSWHALKHMILPGADQATRTLRVRFEVPNPGLTLRPGMTAKLLLKAQGPAGVLVPTQAVIDDGKLPRVIIRRDGRFYPTPVAPAGESGGMTAIASGIAPGDEVVTSGIFLIDAEANISGALARLTPPAPKGAEGAGSMPDAANGMAMPQETSSAPASGHVH